MDLLQVKQRSHLLVAWPSPRKLETILPCPQIIEMCGRYVSFLPPEFLARLFATVNPLPNLQPNGSRHLDVLKWA